MKKGKRARGHLWLDTLPQNRFMGEQSTENFSLSFNFLFVKVKFLARLKQEQSM